MNYENIPKKEYVNFLKKMPLSCVDLVVHKNKKVLLVRRSNEPEKGKWWVPGGRIYRDEKVIDAARRKLMEETGLEAGKITKLGFYEYFSEASCFPEVSNGSHSLVSAFIMELKDNSNVKLDGTSSEFKWISSLSEELEPYIFQLIKDSGVLK